ncbi:MAG: hypothetical protein K6T29_03045, partial [Peptococcaceae bacterium]|nr:hypothetical protein [Peptococcaceae bacterium]
MLEKVAGFPALLRRAGVRVSPAETEDFLKAILLLGMEKEAVESAALATLAKGEAEKRTARKFFRLYFNNLPAGDLAASVKCDPEAVLADPPRLGGGEFLARLADLRASLRKELAML